MTIAEVLRLHPFICPRLTCFGSRSWRRKKKRQVCRAIGTCDSTPSNCGQVKRECGEMGNFFRGRRDLAAKRNAGECLGSCSMRLATSPATKTWTCRYTIARPYHQLEYVLLPVPVHFQQSELQSRSHRTWHGREVFMAMGHF